ncbi:MAG: glycosyltransferase [Roseivirga sp.]|nr:glycosyltransferase [Roseivirga sp.]
MRVSIITVVYNGERFIKSAIESVLNQNYGDIEHIVIDGDSSDGTMEIINRYKDKISTIVSEPDKGLYDAMNKGLSHCTGEIVGILNADDFYKDSGVISRVVECFKEKNTQSIYGDLIYVDQTAINKVKRYWKGGIYKRSKFLFGWMPPYPTFFVKREVYDQFGNFNIELKSAADYEFMLRVLYKHEISSYYLNETLTIMREGGLSNSSISNRLRGNSEDFIAWKINDIKPFFFTRFLKPLRKLKQFVGTTLF